MRVAFPFGPVLVGLIDPERPLDVAAVRNTVLLNPLTALRFMVEVADEPAGMMRIDGLAAMVKSGWFANTVTDIATV